MKTIFIFKGVAMNQTFQVDPIRAMVGRYRARLALAASLVSISALLELLPCLVVYAAALEIFSDDPDPEKLGTLSAVVFGGVAIRFLLLGGGYIVSHGVAFSMMRELRLKLIQKLSRVPGRFFSEHQEGDLKKAIVDDVAALEGVFAHNIPELASGIFVPLTSTLILLWVDWRMALAALAILPVAFGVQARMMSGMQERWDEWHAAEARANRGVLEFIRGIVVLKLFNRDVTSMKRVRSGVLGIRDLAVSMTHRSMSGYAIFFTLLSCNLLVVLPVGLALLKMEAISRDELVLFVALGTGILLPLNKLLFLFGSMQKVNASLTRIRAVLNAQELDEPHGAAPLPETLEVRFDDVEFSYPDRDQAALQGVSFSLPPRTTTAVVGTSGAGKSTLVKLLVRAYDPDKGTIRLGGQDLRGLSTAQRTSLISHVSQDTTLFHGTIRDNLLLANPEASEEAMYRATEAARAHDFITNLPGGYDEPIGDRGNHLSGGEKQRIAIARALLKDAPLVVLDEITANVDPESERGIQEGLSALSRDKSVIFVAHRLRTVVGADQILVMEGGNLVDQGTHHDLLQRCKPYIRLWNDQTRAEQWTLTTGAPS